MHGTVKDINGNEYCTIKIGNQEWMAENLRVDQFSNGQPINEIKDGLEWQNVQSPAQCVYKNDHANIKLGRLYNWFCVSDQNNICPEGWRIPTLNDWTELVNQFGGWNEAGSHLSDPKGFNASYNGYRMGQFEGFNESSFFWTADTEPGQPVLGPPGQTAMAINIEKQFPARLMNTNEYMIEGFYIRCLKM